MTERDEAWKPIPGYGGYEASDKGRIRSTDRTLPDGRKRRGQFLTPVEGNRGYLLVTITDDAGRKQKRSVHRLILTTFEGPCPEGHESLHGKAGQLFNWWPENLRWGTKAENAADKPVNGGGEPSFPCRNAPACGNMVMNEGRRCKRCATRAAVEARNRLNLGQPLDEVTRILGYESSDWVFRLARELGGYEGAKRDARSQRPSLSQRVAITVRDHRRGGWGGAA